MRTMLRTTNSIERMYAEAHISSVVAIGLDYGFDIVVERYSSCTIISLKQHYIKAKTEITMDSVEITFYHDRSGVYVERVKHDRKKTKLIRSIPDCYEDFNNEALEKIMRLVWDIETE